MKRALFREQMRAFDHHAITECHVPGLILMENAGRGVVEVLASLRSLLDLEVVILCGTGNNGGDGFVVARHLGARGAKPQVFLCGTSAMTADTRVNHDAFRALGGRCSLISQDQDLPALETALQRAPLVVDALLGTGLCRPVTGLLAQVIEAINGAPGLRVAVDLPSGLDANTGTPLGVGVHAQHTIALGHGKVGLFTAEGVRLAGTVHFADLGVPDQLVEPVGTFGEVLDLETLRSWVLPRETTTHKYQAGGVLVLAGSPGKTGAAQLTARAVLRGGAGLCTLATWPEGLAAVQGHLPEVMTAGIDPDRLPESLDALLQRQRVAVLGPGLGLEARSQRAVAHVVSCWDGIKVLDADALAPFAGHPEALALARGQIILTPHAGEMGRLLGISASEVERDRFAAVQAVATRGRCTVLLKGPRTLIASGGSVLINPTGNPALAVAGSGDTLAGLIGALACSLLPLQAAATGAFLHGLAADRWQQQTRSDRGLLASELADLIPPLFGELFAANGSCLPRAHDEQDGCPSRRPRADLPRRIDSGDSPRCFGGWSRIRIP